MKLPELGRYTTEQMLAWGKACAEAEREAIVEVINELMIEVDQIPHTATTKSANATVRVVGKKFVDLIRARGNT
jgi:hypothetical protein